MLRYVSWLLKDGPAVPSGGGVSGSTTSPLDVDPASDTSSIKQLQPRQTRSRTRARTDASRSSSTSSERTLVDASIGPQFAKLGLVLEESPIAQEEADRISIPELYYRCHNASHFPSAPPMARRFLLRFLSDLVNPTTEQDLRKDPDCILSLSPRFDSAELDVWLDKQYRRTTDRFEAYLQRRKAGGEREMFKDRSDAVRWCRQSAVVKYVDGSWLQSTLQTTSGLEIPRAMQKYTVASARRAARVSWQVLSEELGDGDIEKEHCAVFERLMDSLAESETDDKGAGFGPAPEGDEEDFASWNTDPETGEFLNKQPYIAAMLQLAMCVSPNEFLPEILGFNLSYEGLPLHLLITAHELRQLKIDPYYFVLHISIDNSDSGHSAMAKQAVEDFLHAAAKEHGPEAADKLWRRVQAGFIMADSVRTTPRTYRELAQGPPDTPKYWTEGIPLARDDMSPIVAHGADRDVLEAQLLDVFRAKAYAANGLHCTAPARIGGKRIGEWLTPESLAGESGEEFMRALALSRAWVRPGPNSHNSRLINECEWGGRMFGAFTNTQVALMKEWAAALPDPEDDGEEGCGAGWNSNPLPSSEELRQNLVRPYLQYLSGKLAGVDEEDLQASAYYSRAILPIDFSSSLRNVTSFPQWRRAAPRVYQTILEHPHGVRGVFRFENVAAFLLDLLPASTSFAVCASPSFVETLVQTEAPALRSTQLDALLPALFTSPALLEWMPAAGPSKLASPLGMAVIKIQRSLYGFSSEESADTVGCAGMDDVHSVVKGVWDLACDLREDGESTLDDFRDGKGEELALPALILLLNSQPTLHLPILLGLQLGLNVFLHEPLSVAVWTPSPIWRERMAEIVHDSRNWIMDCIVIGSSENTQRGWEGDGDWNENVLLGFLLAKRCLC